MRCRSSIGFAPLIEIRSIESFELIDRIDAPPYPRCIDFDQDGRTLFLSAGEHGQWALDMTRIERESRRGFIKALDPFYLLLNAAFDAAQHIFGSYHADINTPLPEFLYPRPCTGQPWTTYQSSGLIQ